MMVFIASHIYFMAKPYKARRISYNNHSITVRITGQWALFTCPSPFLYKSTARREHSETDKALWKLINELRSDNLDSCVGRGASLGSREQGIAVLLAVCPRSEMRSRRFSHSVRLCDGWHHLANSNIYTQRY